MGMGCMSVVLVVVVEVAAIVDRVEISLKGHVAVMLGQMLDSGFATAALFKFFSCLGCRSLHMTTPIPW